MNSFYIKFKNASRTQGAISIFDRPPADTRIYMYALENRFFSPTGHRVSVCEVSTIFLRLLYSIVFPFGPTIEQQVA